MKNFFYKKIRRARRAAGSVRRCYGKASETAVRLARIGKARAPTMRECYEKPLEIAMRLARLVFLKRILA